MYVFSGVRASFQPGILKYNTFIDAYRRKDARTPEKTNPKCHYKIKTDKGKNNEENNV